MLLTKNLVKKILICLAIFFHSHLYGNSSSSAANEVIWAIDDSAPYYLFDGLYKDQGIGDGIIDIISKKLPEYIHKKVLMSPARSINERKLKKNICTALNGPFVSTYGVLSIPSTLMKVQSGIYFKKGTFEDKFFKKGYIEEAELAQMQKKVAFLQAYLDYYSFFKDLNFISLPSTKQLHKLLFSDRVDYILSSAEEIQYHKSVEGIKTDYDHLTIKRYRKDHPEPMIDYGYISCTKSQWGEKIIEKINNILIDERPTEAYKNIVTRWLPETVKKEIEQVYLLFQNSKISPK